MQVDADSCTLAPGESGLVELGPFEAETRLYIAPKGGAPALMRVARFEVAAASRPVGDGTLLSFGEDAKHVVPADAPVVLEIHNGSAVATRINAGLWTVSASAGS
jgi:hypothetical protein